MDEFELDPDNKLLHGFDWSAWLNAGEVVSASEWIVPNGIVSENEQFTPTETITLISGGVSGEVHLITNRVTTSLGQICDRSFKLKIRDQ